MLLRSVRAVAALANPGEPTAVTQRAFDAVRERSADHAELPPARRITEQLGLPWRELLAVAHQREERQAQLVGVKTRARPATDWLSAEVVAVAVRLVAARLGTESLTARDYRVERARLLAQDRARWRHGRGLLLPDNEQIIATVGSWDDALRQAGLRTRRERGLSRRPSAPRLGDLLERFHQAHAFQPSARELRAFASGNGIPYPSERAQRFGAAVAEWVVSRRARGLPDPRVVTHAGGRGKRAPDYSRDVGAARSGEQRRRKWTRASCAAVVAQYLVQLPNGARSTQRGYADWANAQPRGAAPTMSTILEHGGWEAVRRETQQVAAGASPRAGSQDSELRESDDDQGGLSA